MEEEEKKSNKLFDFFQRQHYGFSMNLRRAPLVSAQSDLLALVGGWLCFQSKQITYFVQKHILPGDRGWTESSQI